VVPDLPVTRSIALRAESLRRGLYYRLDTRLPLGSARFVWPRDPRCSNEVRLRLGELGILARTEYVVDSYRTSLVLPVAIGVDPVVSLNAPYRVLLLPGRRIHEIYLSIYRLEVPRGRTALVTDRALEAGPYAPDMPIVALIKPGDLRSTGRFLLKFIAEFDSGEAQVVQVLFFHRA
jgi:hypothetical protein